MVKSKQQFNAKILVTQVEERFPSNNGYKWWKAYCSEKLSGVWNVKKLIMVRKNNMYTNGTNQL